MTSYALLCKNNKDASLLVLLLRIISSPGVFAYVLIQEQMIRLYFCHFPKYELDINQQFSSYLLKTTVDVHWPKTIE